MQERKVHVYGVYPRTHHTPLALGFLNCYASAVNGGALAKHYRFVPGIHSNGRALAREVRRRPSVLLFSHYMWNTDELLAIAKRVKDEAPDTITIHGGPSIPKYEDACRDFMSEHPEVDVAVRGEGERVVADLLEHLAGLRASSGWDEALEPVRGITFRSERQGPVVRTPDRDRIKDLSILPSPFLGGQFDGDTWVAAILETNRGCPYGCTFCDWGSATLQKIHMFPLDRIKEEIDWVGRRRIPVLHIVDANFGIFERDLEIAEHVIKTKEKYGFPCQFVCLLAKNSSGRVTEIVKRLVKARLTDAGRISIQTTDARTLAAVRRSNIKTSRYVDLRRVYASEKLPIATELILALPEQTVDSFKNDLQFCLEQQTYISLITCVVLPNSPMATPEYMKKYEIEIDEHLRIVATSTLDRDAVRRLEMLWGYYYALVDHGVAKYILYYLQHDHGLRALDVLDRLVVDIRGGAEALPEVQKVVQWLTDTNLRGGGPNPKLLFYRWKRFYDELGDYLVKTYRVERDSAFAALLEAQLAVMPTFLEPVPRTVQLAHDVAAYVRRIIDDESALAGRPPPLALFHRGSLEVRDPLRIRWAALLALGRLPLGQFRCYFELDSAMSADVSRPHFLSMPNFGSSAATLRYAKTFAKLSIKRAKRMMDSHGNLGRSLSETLRVLFEPAIG